MRTWFNLGMNEAEIKTAYRNLARQHHPDVGGDTATMQDINAEYEKALKSVYAHAGYSEEKTNARWEVDKELARKAAEVFALKKSLEVEICGVWLWITGETRKATSELKSIGCHWAPKKMAWYYHKPEDGYRRRKGREIPLEQIRSKYGSVRVEDKEFGNVVYA